MTTRVPADGARRRGTSKSRAVAGAQKIRTTGRSSDSTEATVPSAGAERLWGRARRSAAQRARRCNERPWNVVDDLPDPLPVTQSELDVIETYLVEHLDELLKSRPAA